MPIYENFPSKEPPVSTNNDGLMSKEDKAKLDGIAENANNYIHPDNETIRHVTDAEKAQWSDNTKYTNDMPTVISVGGIAAGTTFDNMGVSEILNKLFYPYVPPVVSASCTPNGGTYEKGTSVDITQITVSVTKKSENITKVEIFDGSTSLGSKTDGSAGNVIFPLSGVTVSANKNFTAKVTDASNNTVTANTGSFNFVYPYFQGIVANTGNITEPVLKGLSKVVQAKGNKSFDYTANNQRMVIAYPKSYGTLNKIVDPNQFDVTATWTRTEINITTADNQSVAYYVYTSKAVTVDNYRMQFNY